MSRFVQFVVCQHNDSIKKFLFYAPFCATIKSGDEVLVDTQHGERMATVLAVCSSTRDDLENILRVLAGAEDKPVKRVIGKYEFTKFNYEEEENNE
nr:MAG TPA: hypothetical protein [Caudoviricetes sp.]